MFKKISDAIKWPTWATERFKALNVLERCLTGTFYDHIQIPFTEETQGSVYIPISDRRPSVQYNLPHMIAVDVSRWLWAGRNRPQLTNDNADILNAARDLVKSSCMVEKLAEATIFGSVGSVAVTFQIRPRKIDPEKMEIVFDTWRAKDCWPTFDDTGELQTLRVQYIVEGRSFLAQGVTQAIGKSMLVEARNKVSQPVGTTVMVEIKPDDLYWFTRDYDTQLVKTYVPIEEGSYKPDRPEDQALLRVDVDRSSPHALGYVPGVWIRNLPGGNHPDGASTFRPAMGTAVILDYTLSQIPRGMWANLCPQLVLEGELINQGVDQLGKFVVRGPANVLQFPTIDKGVGGQQDGGGKAYLLESDGQIFASAIAAVNFYIKMAKDQIHASRKDPDKLDASQSGKAINSLEDEHQALVDELREAYGDHGFVPLLGKALRAASLAGVIDVWVASHEDLGFGLQYRKPLITPDSFALVEPALVDAVARKLLIAEDVARWMIGVLDLPEPPDDYVWPEEAGMDPTPPIDPNKAAALAAKPKPKPKP